MTTRKDRGGKWIYGSAVVRRPGLPDVLVDKEDNNFATSFRVGGEWANYTLAYGGATGTNGELWYNDLEEEITAEDAVRLAAALLAYADEKRYHEFEIDEMPDCWDIDHGSNAWGKPKEPLHSDPEATEKFVAWLNEQKPFESEYVSLDWLLADDDDYTL